MKIATKKFVLYLLTAVFAICIGAFAVVFNGDIKTVSADDPTVINLTLDAIGISDHNDKAGVYGITRITALRFSDDQPSSNTGVFSGSGDGVYDWTNLEANTTYTGSGAYMFAPANVTWASGYKSSTFNFIYFCTVNQPSLGDTLTINAGAYFTMTGTQVYPTSGTCNDKYVITADITIRYNGTAWEYVAPVPDPVAFVLGNDLWAGADQSGKNGAQLTAWGIDNDGNAAAYPTTGTFALLNIPSSPLAIGPSDNLASSITGIKYNGTPINEISGAVVAEWLTYLAIYVPYRTGIIHFEKNTVIGSGYLADDYYYSLSVIGGHGRATFCYFVEFDSNGGSEVESVYVNSGALVTSPEIQFRTIGDKEFYIEYWYLDDENVAYDFATPVTSNMSLTAKWSETTYYTVTFDSEGGTAVAPAEVLKGLTVSTPTPPTKEQSGDKGYVFEYWYLSDESVAYDFATPITGNITLHAKWREALIHTVTFNSNGGTSVLNAQVEDNTAVSAPTAPTRNGDIFEYWYLNDENTPYDFATPVTENITLNAKWTVRPTVNVTFSKLNSTWNNYPYDIGGYTRYNVFEFTGGISSGHHGQGMDMSNLVANTTYTGSSASWGYISMSMISGPNVADSNMIIFRMNADPTLCDTIEINAGAWFIVGGEDNSKYVLTDDILLTFNGTHWVVGEYVPPTETNVTFSGLGAFNNAQVNPTSNYVTQLVFTSAITSGGVSGYDYSNLIANTTYKDKDGNAADVTWNYISGFYLAGENKAVNYIVFFTDKNTMPSDGDTVTINSGAWFMVGGDDNNKYILTDEVEFVFMGEWVCNYDGLQDVEFVAVHFDWNNIRSYSYSDTNVVRTLLVYDKDLGSALNANNHVLASKLITVNGVKLSEISGATVDYSLGQTYVMITLPESALIPTLAYPITKLEIAAGTPFENSKLPALTLSLIGGAWIVGEFPEYALSGSGYTTVSDIAGKSSFELKGGSTYPSTIDGEDVDLRFVLTSADFKGVAYLAIYLKCSETSWDGFRFEFTVNGTGYVVNVYDATAGGNEHVLLGTFPVGLAANDYAKFAIIIDENAGEYSIVIVEDGLKIGEITNITPVGDKIGSGMLLYSANNDWTLSDYKDGDVSAPYICVDTPLVYFLTEGDDAPEIGYRIFDRTNDPSTVTVETVWDDGAKTENKMNAGTWHLLVRATDEDGNVTEKTITVNVYSTVIKYVVKFNGKNATEYEEGSLIAKPTDPTKASTNKIVYVFDGWYNGNYKWDFTNDVVSGDVNLTAKFIETERLYKVTIIVGEERYEVYAKYGAQPDLSMLSKSGYDIVLTVDGKEVEMISVTGDTTVNVSYAENKNKSDDTEEEKKSGCGSSLSAEFVAVPVLAAAVALILRKKERKDEE